MSPAQISVVSFDGLPAGVAAAVIVFWIFVRNAGKVAELIDAIRRLRMTNGVVRQVDRQSGQAPDLARMVEAVMGVPPASEPLADSDGKAKTGPPALPPPQDKSVLEERSE
jgi:hypothetical protein